MMYTPGSLGDQPAWSVHFGPCGACVAPNSLPRADNAGVCNAGNVFRYKTATSLPVVGLVPHLHQADQPTPPYYHAFTHTLSASI